MKRTSREKNGSRGQLDTEAMEEYILKQEIDSMRYFPRGEKIQRILLYDRSFYKEDSMMKRKQAVLMMAVMTALLTPSFGGGCC